MPIYEYECLSGGHRFEEFQKMGARPLQTCRVCGSKVRKLISASSFRLKGGGWYKTEYGKGNGKKPKSAAEGASCEGCPQAKTENSCEAKKGASE